MSVNESVREVLTEENKDLKARLADECAAHEDTKAKLACASRLHSLTVLQLENACKNLRTMAEVVDSIEPECCEYCGENDPHSCEDDGIYTGPEYPHIDPLDEDPCFYAAPGSGVARNTTELLEMIDAEEEDEYEHDHDEY